MYQPPEGYSDWPWERSGKDKGGGGLNLIYRKSLNTHKWIPVVPPEYKYVEKERQWLLIKQGEKKCAFLHCYIACKGKDDSFLQWNEDLFCLMKEEAIKLRREGFAVLAMGDFNSRIGRVPGLEGNTPDTNRNQPMFMNFLSEVHLGMPYNELIIMFL